MKKNNEKRLELDEEIKDLSELEQTPIGRYPKIIDGDEIEWFPKVEIDGKMLDCKLNERIKELRIENGLSQNDLSTILDISRKDYWRYEQPGYSMSIQKLSAIAILYNVSIDWLSGYYPTRKPFFPEDRIAKVNGYSLEEFKASKIAKKSN